MEAVIARLLNDFESGKLTRRQLVQTLAMVAVGSPMASALARSAEAAPGPSATALAPWKTVWLDHISYAVSDYKKSVDFYTGLMGWEVKSDTGTQAMLDINGIGGIIIRNARRPGQGPNPAASQSPGSQRPSASSAASASPALPDSAGQARAARPPITGVINHISWGVQPWDTDAVKAELERRGLNPRPDMQGDDFKSFHVRDPDGWDLQISNQTKEKHTVGG
jgi:catechol 2,3-dioxygenase-like lactoylglutathione lyase family enzyme